MVDMSVKIGSVTLKNPIMPASGCFSTDLAQVIDLNRLGALVAKTVSRASVSLPALPASMTETISATSMTVTARASTRVPKGSPTRCATTSACQTAANTVATSTNASAATTTAPPTPPMNVATSMPQAKMGHAQAHHGIRPIMPAPLLCSLST